MLRIIISIIFLSTIFRLFKSFRAGRIGVGGLIIWGVIWFSILIIAFLPGATYGIADILNIERPIDSAVYLGIVLLFYICLQLFIKLEKAERRISLLSSDIALQNKHNKSEKQADDSRAGS